MIHTSTSLHESIYYAAKDGMAITLYAILENKSADEVKELLETAYSEDGQKTTPLIITGIAILINDRPTVVVANKQS